MAESSRSRVTITLGRSGQVVKRASTAFDSGQSEYQPAVGSKRSVRDRLGSAGDGYLYNNKRKRGDNDRMTANDSHFGKNDLRFKLMQKNLLKQEQSNPQPNGVEQRQTRSGAVQDYKSDLKKEQSNPQPNVVALRQTLSRAVQDYESDICMRLRVPESMDSRYVLPKRRSHISTIQSPPTGSENIFPRMESSRNALSPWTLERFRETPQYRVLRTPKNTSPRRNGEEVIRRPVMRTSDDARAILYTSKDISEPRRYMGSAPYTTEPKFSDASVKSMAPPIFRPPPLSEAEHRSSYRVGERLTLDSFLYSLGLEKYIIPFRAEEVDMATLRQMGERDLKDLGIPTGPRKKILLALLPRSKAPL